MLEWLEVKTIVTFKWVLFSDYFQRNNLLPPLVDKTKYCKRLLALRSDTAESKDFVRPLLCYISIFGSTTIWLRTFLSIF